MAATDSHAKIKKLVGAEFSVYSVPRLYERRWKTVPGVITWPPCSWGYKYGNLALQVGGVSNLRQ
jgi:hypothetical protein